jgi:hypothetical protein
VINLILLLVHIGDFLNYPLFLSDFNEIWIFSTDLKKNQIQIVMKIVTVGTDLFHAADKQAEERADGQTDMTRLIVAFHNITHTHKRCSFYQRSVVIMCVAVLNSCFSKQH